MPKRAGRYRNSPATSSCDKGQVRAPPFAIWPRDNIQEAPRFFRRIMPGNAKQLSQMESAMEPSISPLWMRRKRTESDHNCTEDAALNVSHCA